MLLIKMLQITAAHGPGECEQAVAITLRALLRDAEQRGVIVLVIEAIDDVAPRIDRIRVEAPHPR